MKLIYPISSTGFYINMYQFLGTSIGAGVLQITCEDCTLTVPMESEEAVELAETLSQIAMSLPKER